MVMILIALLVFLAILALGYPLANASQYQAELGGRGDERLEGLASKRNLVFDAIRDLEFDRETGKLSDDDYRALRGRYEVQAAQVMQKMDALAAAKKGKGAASGPVAKSGAGRSTCPKCQAQVQSADRFCPVCGTRLS